MKLSDEEQRGIWKNRLSFNTICYLYGISCVFRFYLNLSHVIFTCVDPEYSKWKYTVKRTH